MSRAAGEPAPEGRRERKRRETRKRIVDAAMRLFAARGYDATTVDDIARDADVSRRSLFDYFPAKEDVVFAHQDDFVPALVEEMRQRPKGEAWPVLVELAFARAIADALAPDSVAFDALVRRTPALHARQQLKYARLEEAIAGVLAERAKGAAARERAVVFAAVVVAGFRVIVNSAGAPPSAHDAPQQVSRRFRDFWASLRAFGDEGLAPRARPAAKPPRKARAPTTDE